MSSENQIRELVDQLASIIDKHEASLIKGGIEHELREIEILNISIKLKKLGHVLRGYNHTEE